MADDRRHARQPAAPPGRAPAPAKRDGEPRRRMRPRFWVIVLVLLALNYLSVALFAPGQGALGPGPLQPRVPLPGRATATSRRSPRPARPSRGEFKKEVTYPPDDKDAEPAKNFDTEIPTFANTDELDALLRSNDVEISAEPINAGRGALMNIILGFGPVILLVALFVWLARRAGGGQMSALGTSAARARGASRAAPPT